MYFAIIVAIGWLYVTVLMAASQHTVLAGIGTLLFYGLLPVSILLYIFATPLRKRRRRELEEAQRLSSQAQDDKNKPTQP